MAKLIRFCVPQSFKPPRRQWRPLEQRGKIIEFQKCDQRSLLRQGDEKCACRIS